MSGNESTASSRARRPSETSSVPAASVAGGLLGGGRRCRRRRDGAGVAAGTSTPVAAGIERQRTISTAVRSSTWRATMRDASTGTGCSGESILVAEVQLHEQHVVALVEARGLDAGELAQFELEVVERVHP